MDKRTMLERAARAAGYNPIRWTDDGTALLLEGIEQPWNPLHENPHSDCMGDALRLAVRLRLVVHVWDDGDTVSAAKTLPGGEDPPNISEAWHSADAHACGSLEAATRRAIVRAAAATDTTGGGV